MATVHLGKKWQQKLAQLPESGMGYQIVDVRLQNGKVLSGLMVFNGEECLTESEFDPSDIAEVRLHQ
jgi:hypothetical protein